MNQQRKAFEIGERVESRVSGWYGTVTMGGNIIVQVLFDSTDNSFTPTARFAKDLRNISREAESV